MSIQIKIRIIVTALLIAYFLSAGIFSGQAKAYSLDPDEFDSGAAEFKNASFQASAHFEDFRKSDFPQNNHLAYRTDSSVSRPEVEHNHVASIEEDSGMDQFNRSQYSYSGIDKESVFGKDFNREKRDSDFSLIQGDFCRIRGGDFDDRRHHFSDHDWDDFKQDPPPAPVPLPSSILLFGTAFGMLGVGLAYRKEETFESQSKSLPV